MSLARSIHLILYSLAAGLERVGYILVDLFLGRMLGSLDTGRIGQVVRNQTWVDLDSPEVVFVVE